MTPPQWLHVTVLRVGTGDLVTQGEMSRMLARSQAELTPTAPITVTLQRVIYHPEAIALSVSPRQRWPRPRGGARRDAEVFGSTPLTGRVTSGRYT